MATPQDYSKLKNDELSSLLKERGLPHTGKKAEMIARLKERDAGNTPAPKSASPSAAASKPAASTATTAASEAKTEVPAKTASQASTAGKAAIAAGGTATRVSNPTAVPNQEPAIDPSTTSDLTASKDTSTSKSTKLPSTSKPEPSAPTTKATISTTTTDKPTKPTAPTAEEKAAEATKYAANLPSTSITDELARRKARAEKFDIDISKDETIKALERAAKFGIDPAASGEAAGTKAKGTGLLDAPLGDGPRRGRKRGSDAVEPVKADGFDDPGLKRQRVRKDFKRGRGGRRDAGGRKEGGAATNGAAKPNGGAPKTGGAGWMSEKDKKAAEARKARFG